MPSADGIPVLAGTEKSSGGSVPATRGDEAGPAATDQLQARRLTQQQYARIVQSGDLPLTRTLVVIASIRFPVVRIVDRGSVVSCAAEAMNG